MHTDRNIGGGRGNSNGRWLGCRLRGGRLDPVGVVSFDQTRGIADICSFSSIVVAVEYGRLVFDNLRKVRVVLCQLCLTAQTCLYLLPAGSFSELMPVLLNILLGLPQILSSLQM